MNAAALLFALAIATASAFTGAPVQLVRTSRFATNDDALTSSRRMVSAVDDVRTSSSIGRDDCEDEMQLCMQSLEKRLRVGPGSLSSGEVSEIERAVARIVEFTSQPDTPAATVAALVRARLV